MEKSKFDIFDLVCINKISRKYEMRKHGANATIALVRYARTRRTSGGIDTADRSL